MRTRTESFVSEIILSATYNNQTSGNVESPTGYFGYMTFGPDEFIIDGMDTPTEFLGRTVTATMIETGAMQFDVVRTENPEKSAQEWFEDKDQAYSDWFGED